MNIIRRKAWDLPERLATPEHVFLNRRNFMGGLAASPLILSAGGAAAMDAPLNPRFADAGRAVTAEEENLAFNNFYEFGASKNIAAAAQRLPTQPWPIVIDGEVEKPVTLDAEELLRKVTLESRVVRHRCVEAWSMVVPWTGFPLSQLVALAKPTSSARYIRFETFNNPDVAQGQRGGLLSNFPWPYVEGLTMEEAMNDLAFMATGAYGKPLPKQMGAPIRLHCPWKYGFKSIKSVVRVSFVKERPVSFWQTINSGEYGFWANVNPDVPHPRWSQAEERILGTGERVPTQLFNGYGEWVAPLYANLGGEALYM